MKTGFASHHINIISSNFYLSLRELAKLLFFYDLRWKIMLGLLSSAGRNAAVCSASHETLVYSCQRNETKERPKVNMALLTLVFFIFRTHWPIFRWQYSNRLIYTAAVMGHSGICLDLAGFHNMCSNIQPTVIYLRKLCMVTVMTDSFHEGRTRVILNQQLGGFGLFVVHGHTVNISVPRGTINCRSTLTPEQQHRKHGVRLEPDKPRMSVLL